MSTHALDAWSRSDADVAMDASGAAAAYARAAARFAAERNLLQRSGRRPAQVRALGAMADLFHTLAEARRARDEADLRLSAEPLESLEDILAAHRGGEGTDHCSGTHEPA